MEYILFPNFQILVLNYYLNVYVNPKLLKYRDTIHIYDESK
jgi:hypothetical protein